MEDSIVLFQTFAYYFEHDKNVHSIHMDINEKLISQCEESGGVDHRIIHNIKEIYDNLSTINGTILTLQP